MNHTKKVTPRKPPFALAVLLSGLSMWRTKPTPLRTKIAIPVLIRIAKAKLTLKSLKVQLLLNEIPAIVGCGYFPAGTV